MASINRSNLDSLKFVMKTEIVILKLFLNYTYLHINDKFYRSNLVFSVFKLWPSVTKVKVELHFLAQGA